VALPGLPAVPVLARPPPATPSRFVLNEDEMNRAIMDEYAPRAVYGAPTLYDDAELLPIFLTKTRVIGWL
jgi:hypothetical protein